MQNKNSQGFTLIEMLIVIAISALLSGFAITYSHTGQDQVALSVEAAKISQIILQAKELSVSTYSGAGSSCAYGVALNAAAQTYSLFTYSPTLTAAGGCPAASAVTTVAAGDMKEYAGGSWNIPIAKGVIMESSVPSNDILTLVLFYPPLPTTFISRDGGASFLKPGATSKIYLKSSQGSDTATISVSPAGQVEF